MGDPGSVPGSGRPPEGGHGNPLQYSCLENPTDRGAGGLQSIGRKELDMKQPTGSKLGKECVKAECCHLAYLTYMETISCEMQGWMKLKLESRLR